MSKTKWTPGPWHVAALTKSFGVYAQDGTAIAKVGGAYGVGHDRRKADALLIAAATEMYEALNEAYRAFSHDDEGAVWADTTIEKARAALAKARGER